MKKVLLMACMMLVSTAMFAQKGTMAAGLNLGYNINSDYKSFGIGAKFQYEFVDRIRGEVSGDYFFKKDNASMWDVNLNFHYLFPLNDKITVYPLAGVGLTGVKLDYEGAGYSFEDMIAASTGMSAAAYKAMVGTASYDAAKKAYNDAIDESASDTHFGVNLGGGIDYFISPQIKLNAEARYNIVKDWNRLVISVGAAYVF